VFAALWNPRAWEIWPHCTSSPGKERNIYFSRPRVGSCGVPVSARSSRLAMCPKPTASRRSGASAAAAQRRTGVRRTLEPSRMGNLAPLHLIQARNAIIIFHKSPFIFQGPELAHAAFRFQRVHHVLPCALSRLQVGAPGRPPLRRSGELVFAALCSPPSGRQ